MDIFNFLKLKIQSVTYQQVWTKGVTKGFAAVFDNIVGKRTQTVWANCVFHPKRLVLTAAMQIVKDELVHLEQMGVLQPVTHSKWTAQIVVIWKTNGSDFSTGINSSLEDNRYPLPAADMLLTDTVSTLGPVPPTLR